MKLPLIYLQFRYASGKDWILIILGVVAAAIHGATLPVAMNYFGHLTNAFVNQFTSKQLANFEFTFDPFMFLDFPKFAAIDPNIILSGFINFTNLTGGIVNCSDDFVLLPPGTNFDETLKLGVTELASCLEDGPFFREIVLYVIGFSALAVIALIAGALQILTFQLAGDRQVYQIRLKFFMSILKQDAEWYDRNASGELSSRLSE